MRQPFRVLVTGSRPWHDVRVIEQALAVILDRHPEGVLLVHGACPRGADAIAAAYAARTPGYRTEAHPADWTRSAMPGSSPLVAAAPVTPLPRCVKNRKLQAAWTTSRPTHAINRLCEFKSDTSRPIR